jgi:shikimate kinase
MKVLTFLHLEGKIGAELDYDKTVIATGGSMVLSENAMENLRKNGKVVFIDVDLDEIKRRVTNIKTRGIAFGKGETLDDVYRVRYPLYKVCRYHGVNGAEQYRNHG